MSQPIDIDAQSYPLQSTEGSPPPTPATTSGSSGSTATTLGIADQLQRSTSLKYAVSVTDGMITKQYDDTDITPTTTSHTEKSVDIPISHTQEVKSTSSSFQSAIKLMVSNNVAGSIIGRAGQTISDLQTQSSARIKLSQTGDYFPGTQDRVCLVQGQVATVKHAVSLLLQRFYALQEQHHTQHLAWQPRKVPNAPTGFDFIVRLLVPSSSCGIIIGKGGANIKQMEELSGVASVRLSPKDGPDQTAHPSSVIGSRTLERVVTLSGPSLESCVKCTFLVMDIMFENHEICRYTNMTTSYSRHLSPGSGRASQVVPSATGEWDGQYPYESFIVKRSSSQPDLSHISIEQQRLPQNRTPSDTYGSSSSQQHKGQRETPAHQFNPSFMDPPHAYNTGISPMLSTQDRTQRPNNPIAPMFLLGSSTPSKLDHPPIQSSSSAPDILALHFQDSVRLSNCRTGTLDYSSFAPQLPQPTRPGFTTQVLVPDNLVGSILGRGGSTLNELQLHSNTRIRISQRGEYVPGTRNRIVTIRGHTAQSVNLAQYLMSQRMVVSPTAGFSNQAPHISAQYMHPSQLQESHAQRIPLHHATQAAPVDSSASSTIPSQQPTLHENAFRENDSHTGPAPGPCLSVSFNPSDKDLSSHL